MRITTVFHLDASEEDVVRDALQPRRVNYFTEAHGAALAAASPDAGLPMTTPMRVSMPNPTERQRAGALACDIDREIEKVNLALHNGGALTEEQMTTLFARMTEMRALFVAEIKAPPDGGDPSALRELCHNRLTALAITDPDVVRQEFLVSRVYDVEAMDAALVVVGEALNAIPLLGEFAVTDEERAEGLTHRSTVIAHRPPVRVLLADILPADIREENRGHYL